MSTRNSILFLVLFTILPLPFFAATKHRISARHTYYIVGDKEIHVQLINVKKMTNVDAIVNAANKTLLGKGGLSGSIFMYGGQELLEAEVLKVLEGNQTIPVGQARLTPLPETSLLAQQGNRYIIHAVGPDYRNAYERAHWQKLLADAYTSSLWIADNALLQSVAFPAIGTSIFGCPKDVACTIAIDTVLQHIKKTLCLRKVIFFFIDSDDMQRYIQALDQKSNS